MNRDAASCYLFRGFDGAGKGRIRDENREAHRARLQRVASDCRCVLGGALRDEAGTMIGTALVFQASARAAVEHFVAGDPYVQAGLFDRQEIDCWTIGLGAIQQPIPIALESEDGAKIP